jgi:hypothetical protein
MVAWTPSNGKKFAWIEIAQPVNSIMAIHTLSSELRNMLSHKNLVIYSMAIDTRLVVETVQTGYMAGIAGDFVVKIIHLVSDQAETGRLLM